MISPRVGVIATERVETEPCFSDESIALTHVITTIYALNNTFPPVAVLRQRLRRFYLSPPPDLVFLIILLRYCFRIRNRLSKTIV